jgi:hypothetical protein
MTQKGRVSPFGDPRIKGCSPLPAAFRSVPRPSSPLSAKASTKCPSTLDPKLATAHRDQSPHPRSQNLDLTLSTSSCYPPGQSTIRSHKPSIHPKVNAQHKATDANGQSHSYPQCQTSKVRSRKTEVPQTSNQSQSFSHGIRSRKTEVSRSFADCQLLQSAPGGADRDRTGDLLLAKQALSQLSYGPGIRSQMSLNPACQPKPQAYLSPLPPRRASADNPPPLAQA